MAATEPSTPQSVAAPEAAPDAEPTFSPRSDWLAGWGWMALGAAIVVGSVMMDRLEKQNINPYTIPGLLPGLLGLLMMLLGLLLVLRSRARAAAFGPDALGQAAAAVSSPILSPRVLMVLGMCVFFAVVLVGHGLPFWVAAALYVTVSIISLQQTQRQALGESLTAGAVGKAVLIGLSAGGLIMYVFQELFLVHLP
jgi:hypothetical protein